MSALPVTPLYSRLEATQEQIRVLKIDSTEPQIVCRLITVSLSDDPAFGALSYTWGDASRRETILVDGSYISVTSNLASAIRSVYYQWIHGDRYGQPRRLWADAVCINQADVKEKEHQIPLMRKIYTTASEVFVWLGTSPENLREAFAAIETVAAAEATSVGDYNPGQRAFLHQWPAEANAGRLHVAISFLFDDEYWSRVWTFQEIVLGKTVVVVSGNISLPFRRLVEAESFLRRYVDSARAYGQDHQDYRSNAKLWFATRPIFQLLEIIFVIREVKESVEEADSRLEHGVVTAKLNFEDLGLLGYQLSRVCALATQRRASEPKDYVYGFSAILDMQLPPDYSPDTSIATIYCDLMGRALTTGGNMCLLLLDSAGVGHSWDLLPGLPSWAPNFASVANAAIAGTRQPLIKVNWASFVGQDQDRPPVLDRTMLSLTCTSVVIDALGDIGPCIEAGAKANWIQWIFEIVQADMSAHSFLPLQLSDIIQAILKSTSITLSADPHPPTTCYGTDSRDYINHNVLVLVMIMEELWDSQQVTGKKQAFFDAVMPQKNVYLKKVVSASMISIYEDLKSSSPDYLLQLLAGWHDMCSAVFGLRIARTAIGHFGLFPPRIRTGDIIAMFNTCTIPAVIRRTADHYTFVGWCYVSKYDGRAIDSMIDDGLGVLQKIELR